MNSETLDGFSYEDLNEYKYAGFWIRLAAYIIDVVVLFALNYMLGYLSGINVFSQRIPPGSPLGVVSQMVGLLYFILLESSNLRGTIGKRAVGIAVVDERGGQITFLRALGRVFGKVLSAILLLIGFIMIAFDKRKQGLHDRLAGTFVVHYKQ